MSTLETAIVGAAETWANAVEAMAEAEEAQHSGGEVDVFESAEFALYEAVLAWRVRRH